MILNFIAIFLFILIGLSGINFIIVLFKYGFKIKTINGYFKSGAIELDKFGNRYFRALWNAIFSKGKYAFGKRNETISSALGKKQKEKSLTNIGKSFVWLLDKIDKNHCENAIKDE